MRVRIAVTVEVDADEWRQEYCLINSVEVREDVKLYCESQIRDSYAGETGMLKVVS